jgi:hypothetical protein
MKDTQSMTIALLAATAVILTALLIGTYATDSAYADTAMKGYGYVMVAGQRSSDMDLLYVVDIAAQKLNVYGRDVKTRRLVIMPPQLDLKLVFSD